MTTASDRECAHVWVTRKNKSAPWVTSTTSTCALCGWTVSQTNSVAPKDKAR